MANFYDDNADLRFYLNEGLDWATLISRIEPGMPQGDGPKDVAEAKDTYEQTAQMVGEFVAEQIAPHTKAIDAQGVHLQKDGEVASPAALDHIFSQLAELGLHRMCLPRELGGLNMPVLLSFINAEMVARADVSIMTHHSFHGAIGLSMLLYSVYEGSTTFDGAGRITKTRFAGPIAEIGAGHAWGCMDITEPDAGSDMAALTCAATQDRHGTWRLNGQKIFITSGHGKYHFVIARSEEGKRSSLDGLSLFLARAYEDKDGKRERFAYIDRLEEKLGHHASATCAIRFENTPAELVGKRGEGFKQMLLLMNSARLGVGFEAIGLCEAAYRLAHDYAQQRHTMGKAIAQHELIADYLDEMRLDIVGLRALAMHGAFHEEIAYRTKILQAAQLPKDAAQAQRYAREAKASAAQARILTPLLKYLAAEKAVEMARRCIQIHGGYGYVREYGAEKLLRDALVTPIYEGTSQIQALMVVKDALGQALAAPQDFLQRTAQWRWRSLPGQNPLERRVAKLFYRAHAALTHIIQRTASDKLKQVARTPVSTWSRALLQSWNPKRDFGPALLHAERLTRMLADAHIAQALHAQSRQHPERRALLQDYLERAELRSESLLREIKHSGDRLLKSLAEQAQDVSSRSA